MNSKKENEDRILILTASVKALQARADALEVALVSAVKATYGADAALDAYALIQEHYRKRLNEAILQIPNEQLAAALKALLRELEADDE